MVKQEDASQPNDHRIRGCQARHILPHIAATRLVRLRRCCTVVLAVIVIVHLDRITITAKTTVQHGRHDLACVIAAPSYFEEEKKGKRRLRAI